MVIWVNVDYSNLIKEIREDLRTHDLRPNDEVQVLRADKAVSDDGYKPIIDYYYDHNRMIKLLAPGFSPEESELEELNRLRQEYNRDRPFLEPMKVADMLSEMETLNKTAPLNQTPAEKLCAFRQEAGLTQKDLAEKASIHFRLYQKYESGEVPLGRVAAETVLALAKALDVSVEDLIG